MIQLDVLKNKLFKAEQAVEEFVNDNMEQLQQEVRIQYNLPSDTPVDIQCRQGYVTAFFKSDRGHTVYYFNGTWH